MSSKIYKLYIIIIFVALTTNSYSTDIGLGVSGEKQFVLNEKVNKPLLKFNSTAPLEDIEGVVENASYVSSDLKFNPGNIEASKGKISFKVDGMRTGISMRDGHLKGESWLNAEKHPNVTFELKEFKNVKNVKANTLAGKTEADATAVGVFSVRGISKSMEIPVSISYVKASEKTEKRASGDFFYVEGDFKIALKDYDIKGAKGLVGSKVGETINISFKLFYNSK